MARSTCLLVNCFRIHIDDNEVSQTSRHVCLSSLHLERTVQTCTFIKQTTPVELSYYLFSHLCYGNGFPPWILMSAMLLFWSHTNTLNAPSCMFTFRSMTSPSEGELRAAGTQTIPHYFIFNTAHVQRQFKLCQFHNSGRIPNSIVCLWSAL